MPPSPEGTAESSEFPASVPVPIIVAMIRPSLRDLMPLFHSPTVERVGYYQISLREMADKPPAHEPPNRRRDFQPLVRIEVQ